MRTNDEKNYSSQGLVNLRSGVCRYLQGDPFNRIMDLTKDSEFLQANRILKGKQRIRREDGEDTKQSKKWVKHSDLEKMYKFITANRNDPETPMHKVFLDMVFYTGRRGREGLRKLTKKSFEVKVNEDGRKYIVMTHNESEKKEAR